LEESLPNSLVHNNEGVLWLLHNMLSVLIVLLVDDLVQLVELVADDLLPHRVTDSIPVNEDVVGKLATIVISKGLEGTFKVLLEHS